MDPQPRGPDWMQITPKAGALFHATSQMIGGNLLVLNVIRRVDHGHGFHASHLLSARCARAAWRPTHRHAGDGRRLGDAPSGPLPLGNGVVDFAQHAQHHLIQVSIVRIVAELVYLLPDQVSKCFKYRVAFRRLREGPHLPSELLKFVFCHAAFPHRENADKQNRAVDPVTRALPREGDQHHEEADEQTH